ncbi:hypothetical protein LYZ90_11760 [Xanthomonas hortorum pv. vitians]|uniref:hypothetical protein n=1 Tax=Xanthomonas hortorum TaxID=56454 RepID=UPI001F29DEF2|nr:hypothetical protein [Xanthomonas hortorum]MCE4311521.1 hypothetical protein [Xanthomonas hortorum pv. vitians]MCE4533527.1 hypothetical protein [Xanthomonas hortorum pv. vitians]
MARCWAHTLGGCDKMSGEHVISNAVFAAGCGCPVLIEGVARIRDGAPTANAEKSNILCRLHNSMLSPLDAVVGRLANFQAASDDEDFSETLYIDGELLERWLLKTIINFGAAGWMGPQKLIPSSDVVSAIFGQMPLPPRIGLYSVNGIDPNHRPSGGVTMRPFFRTSPTMRELSGAYVAVHGLGLLACLDDTLPLQIDARNASELVGNSQSEASRLIYHPGAIVMYRKRGKPLIVGMAWGGFFRFEDGTTATLADAKVVGSV